MSGELDILDELKDIFGFQEQNVLNQRIHMMDLLFHRHPNLNLNESFLDVDVETLDAVMNKVVNNYIAWKNALLLPSRSLHIENENDTKKKLEYLGLYLLIWGEASNLRLMPECLCYIYHHMAFELSKISEDNPKSVCNDGDEAAFLRKVVTPIYNTIAKEARRGSRGKHSIGRNYDDLNEFFWKSECLLLGWPMDTTHPFFAQEVGNDEPQPHGGKVNFVEKRSFLHLFRSFQRMWTFYIICLQIMITIAWNESGALSNIFQFQNILRTFIMFAALDFAQAISDIYLSWKERHRMSTNVIVKYILMAVIGLALVLGLTQLSGYPLVVVIVIQLILKIFPALIFCWPSLQRVNILMWWYQPQLYIGNDMRENTSLVKYRMLFWIVLLIPKFVFSYYVEILPLIGPTKEIMLLNISVDRLPELFPPVPDIKLVSCHDEAPHLVDLGTEDWKKNLKRFYLLLTLNDPVMNVPSNLEARRRLTFFSNSLFMEMPRAPTIRNMVSFSALTPYYSEDVIFSDAGLKEKNEDGMSILFYLQKNFSDEWKNFLERVGCNKAEEIDSSDDLKEERRLWASYRGQTLARTVRGMMYYQKAFELQAFYDRASDEELMEGYESSSQTIRDACQDAVRGKFTYVVSCQQYGIHKGSQDPRAEDIQRLMTMYPYLHVAYVDEEVKGDPREDGTLEKNYYSVLVGSLVEQGRIDAELFPSKGDGAEYVASERNKDEEEYFRIKLPGHPIIGEGKPENQNHAIIFTRGEALQTIDMNQDNYVEEAFKLRNLLQELHRTDRGVRCPTILGFREHIFTGSVRFHYGHPDVFDRVFHLTRGGVSKASKTINLSEDIFGGFNSTLRGGRITHHEYIQVGKGRDVGLHQISMFEAKISNGSGEQILSRDMYRLGTQLGFIRMLSFYFTTVGFYFCSMLMVFAVYAFLYGRLYLVLSGIEENMLSHSGISETKALHNALAPQSILQIGFLTVLPTIMVIGVENGFHNALFDFVLMQLRLAPVFFTFQLGTRVHYFGRTLLHGGAEYRGTGRGFVMGYAKFSENYRFYSRSHFVKAFEITVLLLVYHSFGSTHLLVTFSIWFMVGSWLFVPFLFNPSGFEWHKIHEDWTEWINWIYDTDSEGISVPPEKSWKSWWKKEQEYLRDSGTFGSMCEIVLASRFFIFPYWLVYQLTPFEKNQSIWVYVVLWLMITVIMLIVKYSGRLRPCGTNPNCAFRITKAVGFLTLLASLIVIAFCHIVTLKDIFPSMLTLISTGWGVLLVANACKPLCKRLGIWSMVKTLAWSYDLLMGFLLFCPIAVLAWFSCVSGFQTRLLFRQSFGRRLEISNILGGKRPTDSE